MNEHKISSNKSGNESNGSCNTVVLFKASASDLSKLSIHFRLIVLRSIRRCPNGQNELTNTVYACLTVTVDIAGLFTAFVLIGQTSTIHVLVSLSFYLVSARKKLSQKTLMRIETVYHLMSSQVATITTEYLTLSTTNTRTVGFRTPCLLNGVKILLGEWLLGKFVLTLKQF